MRSSVLAVLVTTISLGTPAVAQERQTGFLDRTIEADDATSRYQVYVPHDYDPARRWPVILFLHGAGERGSDGLVQTEVGLGSAIRRFASHDHPHRTA